MSSCSSMASKSTFLLVFICLNLLLITRVNGENVNCPAFGDCVGLSGRIDLGNPGLIEIFHDNPNSFSEKLCMEYCSWTTNCTFWTTAITDDNTKGLCYVYKSSACDPYTENGETKLPYVTEADNATWTFTSGKLCKTALALTSVVGDPHFTGADASHFDFTGEPGNNYCLLSDAHVHINAYYGGRFDRWGENARKPLTWIRQIGILWGHHTIALFAREGAEWQYKEGYMHRIEVDGERIWLSQVGDSIRLLNDRVLIRWESAKERSGDDFIDVYEVKIEGIVELKLTLRPEVALLRTPTDGVVHFGMEIAQIALSNKVHGVLGQTYRPDHSGRLGKQVLVHDETLNVDIIPGDNAEGFLDGNSKDYASSSLLTPDCLHSRFSRLENVDKETTQAMELAKGTAFSSVLSSRKLFLNH